MGRDVFSRTLEGAGATLTIALAVLAIGFVAGVLIGALCGYYGGARGCSHHALLRRP